VLQPLDQELHLLRLGAQLLLPGRQQRPQARRLAAAAATLCATPTAAAAALRATPAAAAAAAGAALPRLLPPPRLLQQLLGSCQGGLAGRQLLLQLPDGAAQVPDGFGLGGGSLARHRALALPVPRSLLLLLLLLLLLMERLGLRRGRCLVDRRPWGGGRGAAAAALLLLVCLRGCQLLLELLVGQAQLVGLGHPLQTGEEGGESGLRVWKGRAGSASQRLSGCDCVPTLG
jgi:hypothetical protein